MKPTRKIFLITAIFLFILSGLQFMWIQFLSMPISPKAVRGVLDLRSVHQDRTVPLDGQWEFIPGRLVDPHSRLTRSFPDIIEVPADWRKSLTTDGRTPVGYGTYRLRILTNQTTNQPYKINITNIQSSSKLFVNGKLIKEIGHPSENAHTYVPSSRSTSVIFNAKGPSIELLIQVANFDYPLKGGIVQTLKFGLANAADIERTANIVLQGVMIVFLLILAFVSTIIFCFNRTNIFAYFILLSLLTAISVSLDDDRLLLNLLPINFTYTVKIALFSYTAASVLMLKITSLFWGEEFKGKWITLYFWICSLYLLFILLAPLDWVILSRAKGLFAIMVLIPSFSVPIILLEYVLKKERNAFFLLLAGSSITTSQVWGAFKNFGWVHPVYYPFDIIIALVALGTYWIKNYISNAEKTTWLARQLQEVDKTKDKFLINTSHELRTPLHGIINIAETILANKENIITSHDQKDLELLSQVGRNMSFLLDDLLDLDQLKEGKLTMHPENVKVQAIASGVLDMLRYTVVGKPLKLVMNIDNHFPAVWADEKRITQVLFNLIQNAIKFTDKGTVTIHAKAQDHYAYISITDTGEGISSNIQDLIFDPYVQGHPGEAAAKGGIGLGLSICQSLVELHGGGLQVESVPGQGSTFTFSLPLSHQEAVHSVSDGDPAHKLKYATKVTDEVAVTNNRDTSEDHLKILAVDDDPVNLRILCNILSSLPYQVTTALSGEEALEKLDTDSWDLVIADVMMPGISGYELAQLIRKRYSISELPILLLTARTRADDVNSGFLSGANDYVTKPVDALELKARVMALTDLKKSVAERLRMEAAYLQAQIQPHFLFNTLNSITALSDIDPVKMTDLIEAFSSYLRISFNYWNAKQLVPLKHELELVESYLFIEKARFEDRLNYSVTMSPEVDMKLQLPPLSIQPLIENAVRHGVLSRAKGGSVRLVITNQKQHTSFTIIDDGVGMDEEKLNELLSPNPTLRQQGIGLLNTDHRLRQRYGQGLSLHSQKGHGTSIHFTIPKYTIEQFDNNRGDS